MTDEHDWDLKLIEIKSLEHNAKIVELTVNNKIETHITHNYSHVVKYFEKKNKAKISFIKNEELNLGDYVIEFKSKTKKVLEKLEKVESLENLKSEIVTEGKVNNTRQKVFKKRKFRKKFYKKKTK